jgi:hypothetical protein
VAAFSSLTDKIQGGGKTILLKRLLDRRPFAVRVDYGAEGLLGSDTESALMDNLEHAIGFSPYGAILCLPPPPFGSQFVTLRDHPPTDIPVDLSEPSIPYSATLNPSCLSSSTVCLHTDTLCCCCCCCCSCSCRIS